MKLASLMLFVRFELNGETCSAKLCRFVRLGRLFSNLFVALSDFYCMHPVVCRTKYIYNGTVYTTAILKETNRHYCINICFIRDSHLDWVRCAGISTDDDRAMNGAKKGLALSQVVVLEAKSNPVFIHTRHTGHNCTSEANNWWSS
jgi:hypothetical protein